VVTELSGLPRGLTIFGLELLDVGVKVSGLPGKPGVGGVVIDVAGDGL
jgi:hypothetical protein